MSKPYMYNVWNTIHPGEVKEVIEQANQVRFGLKNEKVQQETIAITDEWQKELESMPFVSKQKGKMSHLLKQKSKVGVVQKERVTYDAFDFCKKRRDTDGKVTVIPPDPKPKTDDKKDGKGQFKPYIQELLDKKTEEKKK